MGLKRVNTSQAYKKFHNQRGSHHYKQTLIWTEQDTKKKKTRSNRKNTNKQRTAIEETNQLFFRRLFSCHSSGLCSETNRSFDCLLGVERESVDRLLGVERDSREIVFSEYRGSREIVFLSSSRRKGARRSLFARDDRSFGGSWVEENRERKIVTL